MGCCHNVETTNTIVYIKNDSSLTNTESLSNNNYNAEINWNIPITLSQKEILRNRPILSKLILNKRRKTHFYL